MLAACTDLYLRLQCVLLCSLPTQSSLHSFPMHWMGSGRMAAWKGPPDLVEKKRLSHPIEWSIKKSTREVIRSCKVATLSLNTLSWTGVSSEEGLRKDGVGWYSSLRACYPTRPAPFTLWLGSQSPDTNLGAVKLSALAQLLLLLGAALSSLLTGKAATDLAPCVSK